MTSIDPETASQLVRRIVALSPYAKRLKSLEAEVISIASTNRQLCAALLAVHARMQADPEADLRRSLGSERKTFEAFFEQMYFSSPAFLASVGEWPIGDARD